MVIPRYIGVNEKLGELHNTVGTRRGEDLKHGLVEKLKGVNWGVYGAVYVILFGSALHKDRPRDIDIAVMFSKKPGLDDIVRLMEGVAEATSYPMENIDVVPLNYDVPCELFLEIVKGVPLYVEDLGVYVDEVCRRIMLCYDNSINTRKLRVVETALKVVKERIRSGDPREAPKNTNLYDK